MFRPRDKTARTRFTALYAATFLASAVALLGLTAVLGGATFSDTQHAGGPPDENTASQRVAELQRELDRAHTERSRQLLGAALVALLIMIAVSLVLGRLLARRVLRPLRLITAATRGITADSLDRRLAVAGPDDEVKDLADTVDDLLGRLETSFTAQRRFAANASHELRTPLATMRANVDVAAAKPHPATTTVALAERLRPQLDRLDHLLDGLLVLARAQHGSLPDATAVDLAALVGTALRDRATDIDAKRLDVTVAAPTRLPVDGNPALLARLVANVVDNAVTHTTPEAAIHIAATDPADVATLTVDSGGPPLDPAQVERLARPFERLGDDRTGASGLGLSIVDAIAAAHRGTLALTARPEGGLRVTVTLPKGPSS
ncbi:MAG TPA: HAMP domain-containing sensor histidine kinase [Stackebrandtia sp.]|jgi:signal transduction histidine kinase|uniref:sensor histidine kinase n=1 Tax=Stackebrandtia sp. TaxID=2023065 RepID=UPI002D4E4E02|nr:HAMP domain-containing sensor histidine kinase [Stackebrandtia sp.]HZE38081.1 HAMP domain-containing sensor histidine kinase [Stackebrandtia sp.]